MREMIIPQCKKSIFLLLSGLLVAQAVLANQSGLVVNEAQLRTCAYIADDQLRLLCFDEAVSLGSEDSPDAAAQAEATYSAQPPSNPAEGPDLSIPNKPGNADSASPLLFAEVDPVQSSWFDERWELRPKHKTGTFSIRPYKPVYLLPLYYNGRPNRMPSSPNPLNQVDQAQGLDNLEAKFQISFKTKVLENVFGNNGDVWFGYTQSSRWQVYNDESSRPFRETNYEPELMFTYTTSWDDFYQLTGWEPKMLGISLNHQSNGRALPLSRSWNRLIGMVGLERRDTLLQVRPWVRIPEADEDDDNPDITDYVGRVDYLLVHKAKGHEYSLLLRHNNRFGSDSRGAVQVDWAFPLTTSLRGHLQAFSGYGESLIDYNHRSDYLGIGVSLVGWY